MILIKKENQLLRLIYKETFISKDRMMSDTKTLNSKIARYLFVNICYNVFQFKISFIVELIDKSYRAVYKYIYFHDKFYNECEKYRELYEKIGKELRSKKK